MAREKEFGCELRGNINVNTTIKKFKKALVTKLDVVLPDRTLQLKKYVV